MSEPQVWTLIGVFATGMFGTLALMSTMFVRILRTEIGSVRTELGAAIGSVRTEIGSVRTDLSAEVGALRTELRSEIRSVGVEVAALRERTDLMDRDIQALMRHTFGIDRS
ncbi:MAG: hypothetical protein ACQEW8_14270 [Actinomycetota bacterium]